LFKGDKKLEACLVHDSAHVTQGHQGEHVSKIQSALLTLNAARLDDDEIATKTYGPSTAAAVMAYKTRRGIINFSYQTKADNIVGKMTIAAMDREMCQLERGLRSYNYCAGKSGGL
jgi:peptidoglycan hydrolase-like protein with peptidoglycan-binding domain